MTVPEMIEIKEKRGYSFRQLSELSGIPAVTIQKIFLGKSKNPRKVTLDALARALSSDESIYQGKAYQYAEGGTVPANMVSEAEAAYNYGTEARKETEDKPVFKEKKQGEYTIDDYYLIPEERRFELIDGVLYEMLAPPTVHQDIAFYMHMTIYNHIREKKKPCKIYEAPVDVQLDCDNRTMIQPDVFVVCKRDKVQYSKIYGAPDFALEILSPSTRKKDMTLKLHKYQNAGVREYWIIDPAKKRLIKYDFQKDEFFPEIFTLEETVPLAISDDQLLIDLNPVKESIEEFNPVSKARLDTSDK